MPLTLINIVDLFNDNIDYTCNTLEDLSRLNNDLLAFSKKFELFGDTQKTRTELEKFVRNFESIQNHLLKIEGMTKPKESEDNNRLDEYRAKVDRINQLLLELELDENVKFGDLESTVSLSNFWDLSSKAATIFVNKGTVWQEVQVHNNIRSEKTYNRKTSITYTVDSITSGGYYLAIGVCAPNDFKNSGFCYNFRSWIFCSYSGHFCSYFGSSSSHREFGHVQIWKVGDRLTMTYDPSNSKLSLKINGEGNYEIADVPKDLCFIISMAAHKLSISKKKY